MKYEAKELYKLTEVAEIAKVTRRTVYNYISDGKLKAIKVGGQWRVERPVLEQFIRGGK